MHIISFFAMGFTILQLIPQVVKTIKTKRTHDLSAGTLLIMFVGSLLWTISGIITQDLALIIANIVNLLASLFLTLYKFFTLKDQ